MSEPSLAPIEAWLTAPMKHDVSALAFGGRTVDELLERRPQRHRLLERLDADAHLVAVFNAVIHIEAVYRRPNEASEYRAALGCLAIHPSRLRDSWPRS